MKILVAINVVLAVVLIGIFAAGRKGQSAEQAIGEKLGMSLFGEAHDDGVATPWIRPPACRRRLEAAALALDEAQHVGLLVDAEEVVDHDGCGPEQAHDRSLRLRRARLLLDLDEDRRRADDRDELFGRNGARSPSIVQRNLNHRRAGCARHSAAMGQRTPDTTTSSDSVMARRTRRSCSSSSCSLKRARAMMRAVRSTVSAAERQLIAL